MMRFSTRAALPVSASGVCDSTWSSVHRAALCSRGWSWMLITLLFFVSGSIQQKDPVKNFCRRFGHQTAVIDRKLYIDGGLVNWLPIPSYPSNYTNTWLLYQDLDHDSPDGMPQLYANLSKNSTIPNVNGGILWGDNVNKKFYLFGGEYYQEPPATSFILYAYDVLNNFWISLGPPQQASIDSVSYGAGVAVSERGEGYYYGGWLSNNSVSGWSGPPIATTGLIKYQMDSNTWTNNTGPDGVRRAEGVMLYIPAGDGGMLVYFGGVTDPYMNGTIVEQPLKTIFIYDVLSSKWYSQTATGTVPGSRRRFCAGVTWAPDQSSYNIYLYGGASMPPATAGYDDIYVLSLPSFTWTKMYPTDGNYTGQYPHHSLSCNVVSGAQMLIIGGTFPLSQDCDAPAQWGTHNADLGEQNPDKALWQLFSPNKTGYAVPDPVVSAVGGSAAGGATRTAPANGWDSADLPVLMTRKATIASRTPTRAVGSPTATGGGDGSGGGGGPPLGTGAIVGIAVGGAAAVLIALVGLCCFVRRYRRRRYGPTQQQQPPLHPGAPGQAYSDGRGGHWSPHSGGPYTPANPYPPPSPYANAHHAHTHARRPVQQQQQPPVELAAPGANELHHHYQHHDSGGWQGGYEMGSSPGTGSGTGSSYEPPKFDDQAGQHGWAAAAPVPAGPSPPPGPGGRTPTTTTTSEHYSPPLSSPPLHHRPLSPQELGSSGPHAAAGGWYGGAAAAGGGPPPGNVQYVHQTYYHP